MIRSDTVQDALGQTNPLDSADANKSRTESDRFNNNRNTQLLKGRPKGLFKKGLLDQPRESIKLKVGLVPHKLIDVTVSGEVEREAHIRYLKNKLEEMSDQMAALGRLKNKGVSVQTLDKIMKQFEKRIRELELIGLDGYDDATVAFDRLDKGLGRQLTLKRYFQPPPALGPVGRRMMLTIPANPNNPVWDARKKTTHRNQAYESTVLRRGARYPGNPAYSETFKKSRLAPKLYRRRGRHARFTHPPEYVPEDISLSGVAPDIVQAICLASSQRDVQDNVDAERRGPRPAIPNDINDEGMREIGNDGVDDVDSNSSDDSGHDGELGADDDDHEDDDDDDERSNEKNADDTEVHDSTPPSHDKAQQVAQLSNGTDTDTFETQGVDKDKWRERGDSEGKHSTGTATYDLFEDEAQTHPDQSLLDTLLDLDVDSDEYPSEIDLTLVNQMYTTDINTGSPEADNAITVQPRKAASAPQGRSSVVTPGPNRHSAPAAPARRRGSALVSPAAILSPFASPVTAPGPASAPRNPKTPAPSSRAVSSTRAPRKIGTKNDMGTYSTGRSAAKQTTTSSGRPTAKQTTTTSVSRTRAPSTPLSLGTNEPTRRILPSFLTAKKTAPKRGEPRLDTPRVSAPKRSIRVSPSPDNGPYDNSMLADPPPADMWPDQPQPFPSFTGPIRMMHSPKVFRSSTEGIYRGVKGYFHVSADKDDLHLLPDYVSPATSTDVSYTDSAEQSPARQPGDPEANNADNDPEPQYDDDLAFLDETAPESIQPSSRTKTPSPPVRRSKTPSPTVQQPASTKPTPKRQNLLGQPVAFEDPPLVRKMQQLAEQQQLAEEEEDPERTLSDVERTLSVLKRPESKSKAVVRSRRAKTTGKRLESELANSAFDRVPETRDPLMTHLKTARSKKGEHAERDRSKLAAETRLAKRLHNERILQIEDLIEKQQAHLSLQRADRAAEIARRIETLLDAQKAGLPAATRKPAESRVKVSRAPRKKDTSEEGLKRQSFLPDRPDVSGALNQRTATAALNKWSKEVKEVAIANDKKDPAPLDGLFMRITENEWKDVKKLKALPEEERKRVLAKLLEYFKKQGHEKRWRLCCSGPQLTKYRRLVMGNIAKILSDSEKEEAKSVKAKYVDDFTGNQTVAALPEGVESLTASRSQFKKREEEANERSPAAKKRKRRQSTSPPSQHSSQDSSPVVTSKRKLGPKKQKMTSPQKKPKAALEQYSLPNSPADGGNPLSYGSPLNWDGPPMSELPQYTSFADGNRIVGGNQFFHYLR